MSFRCGSVLAWGGCSWSPPNSWARPKASAPDRRPAARQAGADPGGDRDLRDFGQEHRLADRDCHRAIVALAGRLRPPNRGGLMLVLDTIGKIYPNGVNALERFSVDIRL